MTQKRILITGSSGLIGSEAVVRFSREGWKVFGIDNNDRAWFFGSDGDTTWRLSQLLEQCPDFVPIDADIVRDERKINEPFIREFDAVLHCAAQPAHEWAREHPYEDFGINVLGTLNLLELVRLRSPDAVFVFCSSSKVYGPVNWIPFDEEVTRYEASDGMYEEDDLGGWGKWGGIDEGFPLAPGDGRGIYGTGKVAADLYCQQYGLDYGLKTVCLRGNCMTGSGHSSAQLHGFLAYLAKCVNEGRTYTINGYKGKQVRDNVHAVDYVDAMWRIVNDPPESGEVFNIGGGRDNSCSILEAIEMMEKASGKKLSTEYREDPRPGDHRWYITDNSKLMVRYPDWKITWSLQDIIDDLIVKKPMVAHGG